MQLIIPMTGNGARFAAAGYSRLKPFIEIDGKPMIAWVLQLFPQVERIIFIVRDEHWSNLPYVQQTLQRLAPAAEIFLIKNWLKQGPVYDIWQARAVIDADQPVFVSYCDYYMHWDYPALLADLQVRNPAGCIPCYSGFHPHLIPQHNVYAACKVDATENLLEIREKHCFTADKTRSRHSPGCYYFQSGALLCEYSAALLQQDIHCNHEFYVSLIYNLLVKDGLPVYVPANVRHFCQWGTPADLTEYEFWMQLIKQGIHG